MEITLDVQYDLANLPHRMQFILQTDHWSWKQSKIRIYFLTLFFSLYFHWNEYAISVRLNWWKHNNERISHSKWYFCQRLYLFLLMLEYVAPMHIFITLFYNKAVKNLLLEFISANFLQNPQLTPTGAQYSDDVLVYIYPRQLFQIFTQSIDAIGVTSVTLSCSNNINAIDVTRCWLNVECSNVQMFQCSNLQMSIWFNKMV